MVSVSSRGRSLYRMPWQWIILICHDQPPNVFSFIYSLFPSPLPPLYPSWTHQSSSFSSYRFKIILQSSNTILTSPNNCCDQGVSVLQSVGECVFACRKHSVPHSETSWETIQAWTFVFLSALTDIQICLGYFKLPATGYVIHWDFKYQMLTLSFIFYSTFYYVMCDIIMKMSMLVFKNTVLT